MKGVPKDGQGGRSSRASLLAVALPSVALLMVVGFLLYGTGTMADAPSAYVEQPARLDWGAYVLTTEGPFELYHWHLPLSDLPPDAPTLDAEEVRSLIVVSRHPRQAEGCRLFRLEAATAFDWHSSLLRDHELVLDPGPLPAGGYLLAVPTEDLFGSKTYYYFRLQ